jgi:hypothetical protein
MVAESNNAAASNFTRRNLFNVSKKSRMILTDKISGGYQGLGCLRSITPTFFHKKIVLGDGGLVPDFKFNVTSKKDEESVALLPCSFSIFGNSLKNRNSSNLSNDKEIVVQN